MLDKLSSNMKLSDLTRWAGPIVVVVIAAILISMVISYVRNDRRETREHMTQKESRPPARNMSLEKAKNLLPHLQAFLLASLPRRADLSSNEVREKDKKEHHKRNQWQDLTENENDFRWTSHPSSHHGGFRTAGHTLVGPSAKSFNFEETNELTVIIRSRSLQTGETNKPDGSQVDLSEIVNAAEDANAGKPMELQIPAGAKADFEALRAHLNSKNQSQGTVEKTLQLAQNVLTVMEKHPGVKKQKNPVAIRFRGNQGIALEIGIPDGATPDGSLQVNVAGKHVPTQFKVMASNDNYYVVTYRRSSKGGHVKVYVNRTQIISSHHHEVPFMHFTDNSVEVNPSGSWNASLKEIAVLNRALDPAEIALFRSDNGKSPILAALTRQYDRHNLVPGIKPPKGYQCAGECKVPGMKPFNPYESHLAIPEGEEADCKAVCVGKGKRPYDPYNPSRVPDPSEYPVPLGPGGEWIDPSVCPPVTKDCDGNYTWNGVSYGKSRSRAREIYRINNPYCRRIPDVLDDWWNSQQPLPEKCPFVVDTYMNPCRREACENVNWKEHSPKNLNARCKRHVAEYCRSEAGKHDDFCTCWQPGFENVGMCEKYRAKFENPREYGISPGSFAIEEHPDYDKYIKKDRVPCWGCDLEQASGREVCEPTMDGGEVCVPANE